MRLKNLLVGLLQSVFALGASVSSAHAVSDESLTKSLFRVPVAFTQAMSTAVSDHPKVAAARSDVMAARDLVEAGAYRWAPTFSTGVKSGKEGDQLATATLKQAIWDGGAKEAGNDTTIAREKGAEASLTETSDDIRVRVATAYVSVAKAREMLQLATKNLSDHQFAYDSITVRERGGLGTSADVAMVISRLRQANASVRQWQGEEEKASATFMSVVGSEPPTEMGEFELGQLPSLAETKRLVLDRSPTIRRLRAQADVAEAAVRSAKSLLSPTLSGVLSRNQYLGSSAYVDGLNRTYGDWRFGFNLEWQNDVAFSQRFRVTSAERQTESAAYAIEASERDLGEQVTGYWSDYATSVDRLSDLSLAAAAATKTVAMFRKQFVIGRRSWPEVVNSLSDKYSANTQSLDAKYGAVLTCAKLAIFSGQFDQPTAKMARPSDRRISE